MRRSSEGRSEKREKSRTESKHLGDFFVCYIQDRVSESNEDRKTRKCLSEARPSFEGPHLVQGFEALIPPRPRGGVETLMDTWRPVA